MSDAARITEIYDKATEKEAWLICLGDSMEYGPLASAPLGISALGQLVLYASSVQDCSINCPPKGEKFKYIEYPESLRTTLLQIGNNSYEAFSTARSGMYAIDLYATNMCKSIEEIQKMLLRSDLKERSDALERYVKVRMDRIDDARSKCQQESDNVVARFAGLLALMEEVQKASLNSSTEMPKLIKQLEIDQAARQEKMEAKKKEKEEHEKKLREAEQMFIKVLGEIPSGLALLGHEALDIIKEVVLEGPKELWVGAWKGFKRFFSSSKSEAKGPPTSGSGSPSKSEAKGPTSGSGSPSSNIESDAKGPTCGSPSNSNDKQRGQFESAIEFAIRVKREMVEQLRKQAEEGRARTEKEIDEARREFDKLTIQLSQGNFNASDYERAIETLKLGVGYIGDLLGKWRSLNEFFKNLNVDIRTKLTEKIPQLIEDVKRGCDPNELDEVPLEAIAATHVSSYMISHTACMYWKLSDNYIVPAIGGLNQLSAIPENSREEVKNELIAKTIRAADAIKSTISEASESLRQEFKEKARAVNSATVRQGDLNSNTAKADEDAVRTAIAAESSDRNIGRDSECQR